MTIPMTESVALPGLVVRGIACTAGILLLLAGCTTQAPVKEEAGPEIVQTLEWPAPPEQPRIRYLGELKSLENVNGKKQKSFRDILMGAEETANPALSKPYGVHSDSNGRVYVADTGIAGLVVFNLDKNSASFWGVSGKGALVKPVGVTSDLKGNVYVSDVGGQRVVVFDNDGNYLNAFGGEDVLPSPAGLVFNEENQRLYVVDSRKSRITVFDPQGNVDFTIGENGSEPGNFNIPTNIAVDAKGRLYVADSMNFRIQMFEADGTYIRSFGEIGDRPGNFNRVKGVGVDTDGHIYAVDASYNNFQIFDSEGRLLLHIGEGGHNGPAGFYLPAGAHVDRNNKIFIADQYHQRIQMFEYLGEPESAVAEPVTRDE